MIKTDDAIRTARGLLGTPYSELDCIGLIIRVIRTAPGGVTNYRTAGTNSLWSSAEMSAKYRDLTWRQESIASARAGMLAFKRSGTDVHHVGLVTGSGTVIHSSSVKGMVVETVLDNTWKLLGVHRYIEVAGTTEEEDGMEANYQAIVSTQHDPLAVRSKPGTDAPKLGSVPKGETVDVLAEQEGWMQVRYGNLLGWACGKYLAKISINDDDSAGVTIQVVIRDEAGNVFRPKGACTVDVEIIPDSVD